MTQVNCRYCDDPMRSDPLKYGYAERVRAYLWGQPWRYYHKVPEYGEGFNLAGSWPTVSYKRERCTR